MMPFDSMLSTRILPETFNLLDIHGKGCLSKEDLVTVFGSHFRAVPTENLFTEVTPKTCMSYKEFTRYLKTVGREQDDESTETSDSESGEGSTTC
eukprot:TRINITY_DN70585_c0_g1_i1.p1 TRINITY_DN70585_c0_g1~~TRINITY_DN70585_c0_g1_i1.p1  ORF type:complete len:111 (-),score=29.15 TRINITY_DN70585_c0_g1_i1:303-587(-)